ncbi:3-oxoacyl-ACP reductase [Pacificimonas flava]|uniref:3-oxoacyl-ACP reductase n=2 Tax=Pacificimonas TaxID=1960290 RepID=A0A219B860_9SPHN|nr:MULTISPECIES: SDR family oxidoreductase [Pacificimonas]MBZ6378757.1 SDR family oxidoreductase [Pacificimonas aurantium]OWV33979.1 3-oxoacyl-ACP reductase [Pacificimonas flava]
MKILVTGTSRGIGAAIETELAERGAAVIGHGTAAGPNRVGADFTRPGAAQELWAKAKSALGGEIDVLVNNAGLFDKVPLGSSDEDWSEGWARGLAINLQAPADLSRLAIEHWKARGTGGRIVNIASRAAYRGDGIDYGHYAAAKAGLVGLGKTLARGLAGEGILIYTIAPGYVMTGMAEDYLASRGGEKLLNDIPLGRVGTPEEVASIAAYCAYDAPASMTGSVIDMNGASFVR